MYSYFNFVLPVIRHLRLRDKVCVAELSGLLGVSVSSYYRLENGKTAISFEQVMRLLRFYDVDPVKFMTYIQDKMDSENLTPVLAVQFMMDEYILQCRQKRVLDMWGGA